MLLGIQVPSFTWPDGPAALGRTLRRIAVDAEAAGVSSFWVMDHFFQIRGVGPAENEMLEGYTTLGYVAAATERITLGTMVTGVTYRIPALLIKTVTTLDVLSGGRAWFGVGAAWNEEEHVGLGVPFPPVAERFERLEETLQIARQMYDPTQDGPYEGTHYRLAETMCVPQPLSKPEIMVGGGGERKTLRLVAQYADACNLFATEPDALAHKLDVLHRHCEDVGRDPAEIRVTVLHAGEDLLTGDVDAFVEKVRPLAGLGVDTVILRPPATPPAAWVRDAVAPAVGRVAEL